MRDARRGRAAKRGYEPSPPTEDRRGTWRRPPAPGTAETERTVPPPLNAPYMVLGERASLHHRREARTARVWVLIGRGQGNLHAARSASVSGRARRRRRVQPPPRCASGARHEALPFDNFGGVHARIRAASGRRLRGGRRYARATAGRQAASAGEAWDSLDEACAGLRAFWR